MIRDSSPPLAIFRSGCGVRPGFVCAMNSTTSYPLGPGSA
jgi:hypothetical protein